jgi:hypothetical protein
VPGYDENKKAFGNIIALMRKSKHAQGRLFHARSSSKNNHQSVKVKRLGKILSFTIWAVDGEALRNSLDIDFVAGGNPARYNYVPEDEIWVENNITPKKWAAPVIVHEACECIFMWVGMMSYTRAHDEANKIETKMRQSMVSGGNTIKTGSPASMALGFLQRMGRED